MLKKIRIVSAVTILAMSISVVFSIPSQAINLDTGNGRINTRLRSEEQAVTNFDSSLTSFKTLLLPITGLPNNSELKQAADRIIERNELLQKTSFNYAISDTYTSAANEVKVAAQALTDLVIEVADQTYETNQDVLDARERVETAERSFDAAAENLEKAAAAYEPPSPLWLIPLFGGLIALLVGFIAIMVRKSNAKHARALFGSDLDAMNLSTSQKKQIIRLHSDLPLFEKALNNNDQNTIKIYQLSAPRYIQDEQAISALGKFGAAALEYRALLKLSNQDIEGAKADAMRALRLSGNKDLVSSKVRELANQDPQTTSQS